ncbi:MAG: endonuclease/exonuclease/phosphatase family protein, partial [Flavitalea sp.]
NFAASMNTIRFATYNLRYANNKDHGNLWVDRSAIVINLIRFHDFDILGTQEGITTQLDHISEALPYFERFGAGRDDGALAGEHSAIFFKKEKFTLLQGGNFWLSETPGKPGFGWDARHNRICSWVELKVTATGKNLFVFNAHFDHYGKIARNESSKLVLERIASIAGTSDTALMGDFNDDHITTTYKLLAESTMLNDTYRLAPHPYLNNPSFNSWGQPSEENRLIDHIFVSKNATVKRYGVLTDTYFSKTPSDHFPVTADVNF